MSGKYIGVFAVGCTRYSNYSPYDKINIIYSYQFINEYINVVKRNGKDLYLSGAMIPPLINMYLMEIDFTYFIGTVLTSQLICIVSFFGIWRFGGKLKARSDSEKTNDTLLFEK